MTGLKVRTDCVHHIPGRLRVRIAEIRRRPLAADRLATAIRRLPGVRSVEARELTGSVLIRYDCAEITGTALLRFLNAAAPEKRELRAAPPPVCRACGGPATGHRRPEAPALTIGPWLLGKTVQFALEKSVTLAIAALL